MAISNQNAQGLYQRDYEHDACGVGMIGGQCIARA